MSDPQRRPVLTAKVLRAMADELDERVQEHHDSDLWRSVYLSALVEIASTPRLTGKRAREIAASAVRGDSRS